MLVLAFDTATPACPVGLCQVENGSVRTLASREPVDPRRHGELLAPKLSAVLAEAGAKPVDVELVAVGLGPGPFTSLRVGVVTAAAVADALELPVHGICTLDAMAADLAGPVVVATDARRREVYWASYLDGRRVDGPAVNRPADVPVDEGARVVGGGGELYRDVFGAAYDPSGPHWPAPATLARLAAAEAATGRPPAPLVPLYLRRPDAAEPSTPKPVLR